MTCNCPYCDQKYYLDDDELEQFEVYECPQCGADVYFENCNINED